MSGIAHQELDADKFVSLLEKLINQSEKVQNNPPHHVPQEDVIANIVVSELKPYTVENGGPLKVRHIAYKPGRGNVIIEYPGTTDKVVSFVGSHMDVVPASKDGWDRDPFTFSRDGDKLYGRGVTDCLGHVAMLTEFFKTLATNKPQLKVSVIGVFIANEENSEEMGIGIDQLMKEGELERLKNGPVYWVDCSDTHPCIGCGSVNVWELHIKGKLFHSGYPDKAINALELGFEVLHYIQDRFYIDFPAHPNEKKYNFVNPSTMKPTQFYTPPGGVNQIPGYCKITGDVRMTPFYSMDDVVAKLKQYVNELDVTKLPRRGPISKYELPEEGLKGMVSIEFPHDAYVGIACDIESQGYKVLYNAVKHYKGEVKPYSTTGSLPIVKDLQDAGFDLQLIGFGKGDAYHANNEYGLLSDFQDGVRILSHVVSALHDSA